MSIINIFTVQDNMTLKRQTTASVSVKGTYQPVTRSSIIITGSIQPITGKELLDLPEAQRTRHPRTIYTETELRTEDKTNGLGADIIEHDGVEYVVYKVEDFSEWDGAGLAHYAVTVLRKDE